VLPDHVQAFIDAEIAANRTDFGDLRAVVLNGTLKPSPTPSHTDGLIEVSSRVLRGVGARFDTFRVVDHTIPPGVYPGPRRPPRPRQRDHQLGSRQSHAPQSGVPMNATTVVGSSQGRG